MLTQSLGCHENPQHLSFAILITSLSLAQVLQLQCVLS